MADPAFDYVQTLIKSGKSTTEIKSELTTKGWEPEVIDLYLGKVKSDTITQPKPRSKLPFFILLILVVAIAVGAGYYFWQKAPRPAPISDQSITPEVVASPSATLAPDSDAMSQLKAGFALLFAPPEYGYEATLSAKFTNCESTTNFITRSLPDSRYDYVDATSSCASPTFQETYRLPDKSLTRSSKTAKLAESPSLPKTSDEEIKKYLSTPENYTIIESSGNADGLIVKARLQTPELEGTYQFTIRPFNHRISQVLFSSALQSSTGVTNLTGDFVFMNRARIPTPQPSDIR